MDSLGLNINAANIGNDIDLANPPVMDQDEPLILTPTPDEDKNDELVINHPIQAEIIDNGLDGQLTVETLENMAEDGQVVIGIVDDFVNETRDNFTGTDTDYAQSILDDYNLSVANGTTEQDSFWNESHGNIVLLNMVAGWGTQIPDNVELIIHDVTPAGSNNIESELMATAYSSLAEVPELDMVNTSIMVALTFDQMASSPYLPQFDFDTVNNAIEDAVLNNPDELPPDILTDLEAFLEDNSVGLPHITNTYVYENILEYTPENICHDTNLIQGFFTRPEVLDYINDVGLFGRLEGHSREDYTPLGNTIGAMQTLIDQGVILYNGSGNEDPYVEEQAINLLTIATDALSIAGGTEYDFDNCTVDFEMPENNMYELFDSMGDRLAYSSNEIPETLQTIAGTSLAGPTATFWTADLVLQLIAQQQD